MHNETNRNRRTGGHPRFALDRYGLALLATIVSLAMDVSGQSSSGVSPGVGPITPEAIGPLGLPRLRKDMLPGHPAPVSSARYEVDAMSDPGPVGLVKQRGRTQLVELPASGGWSRPLRGAFRELVFVSTLIYGSVGTKISLGGCDVILGESPATGSLQLLVPGQGPDGAVWRPAGVHVPLEVYEGRLLAAFPVLTARIDPVAGAWDLFAGLRIVASGSLSSASRSGGGPSEIQVQAGESGAWVCGLVQSSENPLYEDINVNGIDDRFEIEKRGALLPGDSALDRALLAEAWRVESRTKAPPAMLIDRPRPDVR